MHRAFALAEAGALDGRRATTHWRFVGDPKRRFPKVAIEEDQIFLVDGSIWTSAGMAATIDMALAMNSQRWLSRGLLTGRRCKRYASFRPWMICQSRLGRNRDRERPRANTNCSLCNQ